MLRTIDRYVVREVIAPFAIVLVVFTFMLLMQPIMDVADQLIAKGVSWNIVLRVLPTLLPSVLAITIPMALLVGLLIALGRLSEDREWVALQACGVSVYRLVRPVAALAILATLINLYVMIYALPDANQKYNEIVMPILWSKAESEIKPRAFYTDFFPGKVIYVRDIEKDGTWRDVFFYDQARDTVSVARRGRVDLNRAARTARVLLEDGTQHKGPAEKYELNRFTAVTFALDPDTIFSPPKILKSYNQKTIAELNADIEDLKKRHLPAVEEPMAIQQKFSIPMACLVFATIGLALGVSSRKDGKMASFVLGIGVIFAYYVLMYGAAAAAKPLVIPPWSARWVPNVILWPLGIAALVWRARFSERDLQFPWLSRLRRDSAEPWKATARRTSRFAGLGRRLRLPHIAFLRPRILDWYIAKLYFRVVALTFGGLLLIFYIAEFIDLAERVFRGNAKPMMVVAYYVYKTPYFVYFIIPLAGLIAALVTFGLLTRNSELVVMKACGISLYRSAVPLLAFAVLAGGTLFLLEEQVLPTTNRQWHKYQQIFKNPNLSPDLAEMINRGWVMSADGRSIYHFDRDSQSRLLRDLSVFTFDPAAWRMTRRSFAQFVSPGAFVKGQKVVSWTAQNGWTLDFSADERRQPAYSAFQKRQVSLEPPEYFGNEQPDAERMNYFNLRRYVAQLRAGGFDQTKALVDLQRKLAFPCVSLVMTLIAVPFSVTMGRRGTMYGIGLGVVLAIAYWVTAQVFAAFGAGGVLPPALAAWAPNILFAAAAIYLVLTVRT